MNMETIDYLQKLINWDVDADVKFVYIRIDGQSYRLQLKGKPSGLQDPELDFDCVEMSIGNYEFNRYYRIKNGEVY